MAKRKLFIGTSGWIFGGILELRKVDKKIETDTFKVEEPGG